LGEEELVDLVAPSQCFLLDFCDGVEGEGDHLEEEFCQIWL
jgi:hypothetical protein